MNIEMFREYCLTKKGVTEEFPFDENILVFKVVNKMFALTGINNYESINLKCDPERAIVLREEYADIKPGYHMNKQHWNTISIQGSVPLELIKQMIDDSYMLVVKKLTKKEKAILSLF